MSSKAPRTQLALDTDWVRSLLAPALERLHGFAPVGCRAEVIRRKPKRMVVRYELDGAGGTLAVVGKWYATVRGADVFTVLRGLRDDGFAGPEVAVPAPLLYEEEGRALFVEAVGGPTLRKALRREPAAAGRAGAWLARFHRSGFVGSRDCGPRKHLRSLGRWSARAPALAPLAAALSEALAEEDSPGLPVHHDYYHQQVILPEDGPTTIVDLDEAGMGDPGFDVAHFLAHLRMLGMRRALNPALFAGAEAAFLDGYAAVADVPAVRPAPEAVVWMKLAYSVLHRGDAPALIAYATGEARRAVERAAAWARPVDDHRGLDVVRFEA